MKRETVIKALIGAGFKEERAERLFRENDGKFFFIARNSNELEMVESVFEVEVIPYCDRNHRVYHCYIKGLKK